MADNANKCSLAPRDGASKEYQGGYADTLRAIRKGRVKDPQGKLAERTEKFLDGDAYSGGVAQALTDTGLASPLYTSSYQNGSSAYECLIAGNRPKKVENEVPVAAKPEPKPEPAPDQGQRCEIRNERGSQGADYRRIETCTETKDGIHRTTTRTQDWIWSVGSRPDVLVGETVVTDESPQPAVLASTR